MKLYLNQKKLTVIYTLVFELIVLIFSSSFTNNENSANAVGSEQIKNSYFSEWSGQHAVNSRSLAEHSQNAGHAQLNQTNNTSTDFISAYPYFPLIYSGYGVDHMNINLVNLTSTGLIVGDEIGVFDGIYCVGSSVIEAKNLKDNSLSIPASANENTETKPNGYIDGHKIELKTYRSGTIYRLYYQTVNNSVNLFERGGSMFALVDFSKSEKQIPDEDSNETIKTYPNPFTINLRIEFFLPNAQQLNCEIFDVTGKLIKTLYKATTEGQQLLIWDGKNDQHQQVSPGIYFCRFNHKTVKIIYSKN